MRTLLKRGMVLGAFLAASILIAICATMTIQSFVPVEAQNLNEDVVTIGEERVTVQPGDAVDFEALRDSVTAAAVMAVNGPPPGFPLKLSSTNRSGKFSFVIQDVERVKSAVLTLEVFDPDYPDEGEMSLNGGAAVLLFGADGQSANDNKTINVTRTLDRDQLVDGMNTITFTWKRLQGFTLTNAAVSVDVLTPAVKPFVIEVTPVDAEAIYVPAWDVSLEPIPGTVRKYRVRDGGRWTVVSRDDLEAVRQSARRGDALEMQQAIDRLWGVTRRPLK